jgi:hypothetical protein
MCEQCITKCLYYDGLFLNTYKVIKAQEDGNMMKKGDYGLVRCNDPDFVFSVEPTCPLISMEISDDDINAILEDDPVWEKDWEWETTKAEVFDTELLQTNDLMIYFILVKAAYDCGYKIEYGYVSRWILEKLAKFLEGKTPYEEDIEDVCLE